MSGGEPISIRPADADDRAAVHAVAGAAFGDEGEVIVELIEALHAADRVVASLVAERGGRIVGHVMLSTSWIDAADRLVVAPVLSPLSVAPTEQGTGVGRALLAAALGTAEAGGYPAVLLEGDPGYYAGSGFVAAATHGVLRPSVRIPGPAFQIAKLPGWDDSMAGQAVYCDPFWALDAVGLRGERLAAVRRAVGEDPTGQPVGR